MGNDLELLHSNKRIYFVGVDGEGITYPHPSGETHRVPVIKRHNGVSAVVYETRPKLQHDYVLLSVGGRSLHRNGQPLSFDDVMEYLWSNYDDPRTVYVGYYLGYDFTQWFKTLPEKMARSLLTDEGARKRRRKIGKNPRPFPVKYHGWEFDLHAGKRFRLRPHGEKRWMYVNDVGPFFQCSFLSAIAPERWPRPICTPEEYQLIREGKERRSDAVFNPAMIRYNQLENDVLARVMGELNVGFKKMGITLNKDQWYGPGQAAQKWLRNISAPQRRDLTDHVSRRVLQLAIDSYYGGWFVISAHGIISGITYNYDRNSAYPYEIARLPCLKHGRWVEGAINFGSDLVLLDATVKQRDDISRLGSMSHRTRDGLVLQPRNTRGVYWWHELQAAKRAGCIDWIKIHESWRYEQYCTHRPFAEIADLYRERQRVGKNTPLGMAYKLVYNSDYGKIAQSVGDPRYANPIYASLITAGCRTAIWDTIATHPEKWRAVLMVATDGVFFTSPHPGLRLSDDLGDWSLTEKRNLCLMMPGLYWDDATRESARGKIRSRGINAEDLRNVVDLLDEQWDLFKSRWKTGTMRPEQVARYETLFDGEDANAVATWLTYRWPSVTIPIRFGMTSAKLALHRNKWGTAGDINTVSRIITGNPLWKRDPASVHVDENDICWTMPYTEGPYGIQSTPYDKTFGLDLQEDLMEDDILTGDGTVSQELYEWMRG